MTDLCGAESDDGYRCTLPLRDHGVDHFNRTRDPRDWPDPERVRQRSRPIGKPKGTGKRVAAEAANLHDKDADKKIGPPDVRRPVGANVVRVGEQHPATSHVAARRALGKSGNKRHTIYDLVCAAGENGMTDEELERATVDKHQSVSACRNGLVKDGWLMNSGRERPQENGNPAIVWVALP